MYNILKNKIYAYFYSSFVKRSFKKVCELDNEEEVYYRNNKLVVFVKNEEIAERIYPIIKNFKDMQETIYTKNMTFAIDNYIIDEQNRVELFSVDCKLVKQWEQLTKIEQLQELVSFVDELKNKGYILENSKFVNEKCSSISYFLSLFMLTDEKIEQLNGCIINYIHYSLTQGGNLEEFYQRIVLNNLICEMHEFPYALPVITMCYNYFVEGKVPENIYNVLEKEKNDEVCCNYYDSYLIADKSSFKSTLKVIEHNDKYTVYDENIKIYHNICSEFEEFLVNENNVFINNVQSIEEIDRIIIDFNGNIIGYKFKEKERKNTFTIYDKKLLNQCKIVNFISEMYTYLFKVITTLNCVDKEENNFNIEKSLVMVEILRSNYSNIVFKIINIKELFKLATNNENCLRKQILEIFFKLYMIYLKEKYSDMCSEEQFLDKVEVKYLSPILAKEFINYALKKEVDYENSVEEFSQFLYCTKTQANKDFVYDSRFEYNPIKTPFIFDYEAERKYGIKLKKSMNETLSDGRRLITFKQSKNIYNLKNKEESLRQEIHKKIGNIEDNHVRIVGISEIIYSRNINDDNMYNVLGYITEPIKGKQLTDEMLLSLSNRDFLKVSGYLFTNFYTHYIPLTNIWMDNDFIFYVDILDKEFKVKKCKYDKSQNSSEYPFVKCLAENLIKKGYNKNAFLNLKLDSYYNLKNSFIYLANSLDTYCDEHKIFYNGKDGICPVCGKTKYFVSKNFEERSIKIFEDLYAKHYRIDNNYNLKVYKTSTIDMAEIEQNIDKIISIETKTLYFGQECFIPYKKAINEKKQFIGYIYEAIKFNDNQQDINVCVDIKNLEKMKNLPRIKCLVRLILQIKELINRGWVFTKNPFTHVYLSKNHKKQVQILNIEFLSQKRNIKNTIKWTCDYVKEVLALDTSIEVNISNYSADLDSILEKLLGLSESMTKYCATHKMYYKNNYLFCPNCLSKKELKNIEVIEVKKSKITSLKPENEGGESYIYSYDDDLVVKVFKEEINNDFKNMVIARILTKKEKLEEINKKNLKYKYIMPQKLLVDLKEHTVFGYIMSRVSAIPLSTLRDTAEVQKLGFTKKDIFEILITAGEGIEVLHANNIYIGDLNGRNILFDAQKNVYFLDFDGMGVDNIAPEFCTDGYIDPVSKKNQNITSKDDWYSFAIQAFYYLTFTHPFNGIYSIKENGKERILDITDKMERRISLLGNHGMKPPAIAKPWDWMNKELEFAFLSIFEGERRESIVPYLIEQYNNLYNAKMDNKEIRINSKFIATEVNPFTRGVVRIINHYSAICKKEDGYYLSIIVNNDDEKIIYFLEYSDIQNVLLTDNKKIAFVVFKNKVIAINLDTNMQIYSKGILNAKDVVVNDSTLYFTGISEGDNIIFQTSFTPEGNVKEQKIKFLVKQETKGFYAKFNSKFVFVKRSVNNTVDEIYCNAEKYCNMNTTYSSEKAKYNIIYDDATNSWLIINSEGKGIIIRSNGTSKTFEFQESINDINVENISFNKGIIYVPNKDFLHVININDQTAIKKMECLKIMTPNSKLYNICTNGFSVITDNRLYEVRRG